VWPVEFDVVFGLNVNETSSHPAIVNATSHFYYGWNISESSLIVYDNGCLPGIFKYSYDLNCNFYFNQQGTYLYLPGTGLCCEAFPGVGSVPPTFLQGFNYSGLQQIVPDYYGVLHKTNLWTGAGGFNYWTALDEFGSDIQFEDGGGLGIFWNFTPLNVESQDPSIFELPNGFCNINCPSTGDYAINHKALLQDPYIRLALHLNWNL